MQLEKEAKWLAFQFSGEIVIGHQDRINQMHISRFNKGRVKRNTSCNGFYSQYIKLSLYMLRVARGNNGVLLCAS